MVSLSLTAVLLMPTVRDAEYVLVVELQPRHLGGDLVELDELAIPRLALGTEQRAQGRGGHAGDRGGVRAGGRCATAVAVPQPAPGPNRLPLEQVLTGIDDDLESRESRFSRSTVHHTRSTMLRGVLKQGAPTGPGARPADRGTGDYKLEESLISFVAAQVETVYTRDGGGGARVHREATNPVLKRGSGGGYKRRASSARGPTAVSSSTGWMGRRWRSRSSASSTRWEAAADRRPAVAGDPWLHIRQHPRRHVRGPHRRAARGAVPRCLRSGRPARRICTACRW